MRAYSRLLFLMLLLSVTLGTLMDPPASAAGGRPIHIDGVSSKSTITGPATLSGGSGAPPNLPTVTTVPNRGDIEHLLLSVDELPKYKADSVGTPGGGFSPTGWTVNTHLGPAPLTCPGVSLSKLSSSGYASTSYVPQATSAPAFFEQLVRSRSAATEFSSVRRSLDRCKPFSLLGLPGHLSPITFPHYADQSAAYLQTFKLTPTLPGSLLTGSILVRKGNYLMLLVYFPSTYTFRASQLEQFVPAAVSKLPP